MRARGWGDDLGQDARFALRQLRRQPLLAAIAIVTLGLGIGANTAVFSVVRGVLLRPLPYRSPQELVALHTRYLPISGFDIARFPLSGPEFQDYRRANTSLAGAEPYALRTTTIGGEGIEPAQMEVGLVSAGMFELLGVRPLLGRAIGVEEDVPGAPPVVVLSSGLWRSRFGADPGVVGRSILLGGRSARVVGVMPEGFVFPTEAQRLWSQLGLDPSDGNRGGHSLSAVGRLAPGVTLAAARAELATIAERWAQSYPHNVGHFVVADGLRDDLVGDARATLLLLQLAVALVLLVACVNLVNLSLVRSEGRRQELSLRAALGAGHARVARQLLTESLCIALAGAGLGWAIAARGMRLLAALDPGAIPRGEAVRMDGSVAAFTAALAVGVTLLCGFAPALRMAVRGSAGDLIGGPRGGQRRGSRRFQAALVAAEVSLTVVVVTAATLTARSLLETLRADPGLRADGLLTATVALPAAAYADDARVDQLYAALEQRLRAVGGIDRVSSVSVLPLGGGARWDFSILGRSPQEKGERAWNAFVAAARPGYFETVGIPVLRGRSVEATDRADGEPVVWISQRTADLFWPNQDPVGEVIGFSRQSGAPRFRIAGVVGATPQVSLRDEPEAQLYFAHPQMSLVGGMPRTMTLAIRTPLPAGAVAPALRAALRELDPLLPVPETVPMDRVVLGSAARPRLAAGTFGAFGALALILAAIGVYGVASYSVARRTREIGIRVALGARAGSVRRMVLVQGLAPALLGLALGLGAAVAVTPRLGALLFKVSPRDPATFAIISTALLAVAGLATWIPARRALRIPPTAALRED